MNEQLLNKILGEWRDTKFAKNGGSFIECCDYEGMYEQLESFLTQSLTTMWEDGKRDTELVYKLHHSCVIMDAYKKGQEDLKKKILEGMVEHKPHLGSENQDEYVAFSNGYNECYEEIIKLLEKI